MSERRHTNLGGKWVFITGASRGVGRQLALALAKRGCRLLLHARRLQNLDSVARELGQAEVHLLEAELGDEHQVSRLIEDVRGLCRDNGGTPDIIYNNAAVMTPWSEPHSTSPNDYRISFAANVIAPIMICDAFLDAMKRKRSGRLINVTSGIEYIRELLPYSVSKAALDRYVRDVSPSLEGTGVVMSLLDPGWLRTDLGGDQAPNAVESVLPGALVPAQLPDDHPSGKLFCAQDYRED